MIVLLASALALFGGCFTCGYIGFESKGFVRVAMFLSALLLGFCSSGLILVVLFFYALGAGS